MEQGKGAKVVLGGRASLQRPIDWLKNSPGFVVFFLFSSIFLILFFFQGTFRLVEQVIEITIQCKYDTVQQYWLTLCFT